MVVEKVAKAGAEGAARALRRAAATAAGRVAWLLQGASRATSEADAAPPLAGRRPREMSPLRSTRAHNSTQAQAHKIVAYERRGVSGGLTRAFGADAQVEGPRRTALYDLHVARGAKMVPFAGFLLPVAYGKQGIAASHLHTRQHASLFDVSHMMQTEVRGKDGVEFLESICTADLKGLPDNASVLTAFTDPITGGILDDLIVTKTTLGYLHVVSNASRRSEDQRLMLRAEREFLNRGKSVQLRFFGPEERALLALQGPSAARALQPLTDVDLAHLRFMGSTLATVAGVPRVRVTRCGYTGEDGVELAVPAEKASHVAEALLDEAEARVALAGLGARDSLRLEAGLCLYGNDIDHTTTPVEAGLTWIIGKRRRAAGDFPGAAVVLRQLREGSGRRRVGLRAVAGGPPFRTGAPLLPSADASAHDDADADAPAGRVTSGCPSPSLGVNIAMAYVRRDLAKAGTRLRAEVRGRQVEAEVVRMPFVPARYYQPGK